MSRRLGVVLLVASALVLTSADGSVRADEGAREEVVAVLQAYQEAIRSSNPLGLTAIQMEDSRVFDRVLAHPRWDAIRDARIVLQDVSIEPVGQRYAVRFLRVTEELFRSGLFVRTRAWCTMVLVRNDAGLLRVVDHKVDPAPGDGGDSYTPADPFTWGDRTAAAERLLMTGIEHHRRGDMIEAARVFVEAAGHMETDGLPEFLMGPTWFQAELSYFLALSALHQERRSEAYARVEEALRFNRSFPLALNLLARLRFDDNELEAAATLWEESFREDPLQQEIGALAQYLRQTEDGKPNEIRETLLGLLDAPTYQLIEELTPLMDRNRRNIPLEHLAARAHLTGGDPKAALKILEGIQRKRRNPETHYLLGRTHLLMDRPDRAMTEFRSVWADEPGYRDTLTWLIEIPAAQGRRLEALSFAEEGRRRSDEGVDPALLAARMGLLELDAGRLFEATTHLKEAARSRLPATLRRAVSGALRHLLSEGR
ncbi:MAG: hypothetical protein ABIK09_16730 [Pseudomonadota bacterium]